MRAGSSAACAWRAIRADARGAVTAAAARKRRGRPQPGQRLRYERLWKLMGAGFVLLVVYLSLADVPRELEVGNVLNVGHLIAYFWLMIWFAQIYRGRGVRWLWAIAFCALGVALEFAQSMVGYRTFDYADMVLDALGVALGLTLARTAAQDALARLELLLAARRAERL
jgi:VanZ family protein